MTSGVKRWFSAVLALLMVVSPLTAYMEEGSEYDAVYEEEQTEVYSEMEELVPEDEAETLTEVPVTEAPTEVPAAEAPTEVPAAEQQADENVPGGEERAEGGGAPQDGVVFDDEPQGGFGGWDEGPSFDGMAEPTPVPTPEPVVAVGFDMSHVDNPISVPFGTAEGELPLPAGLTVVFSNGQTAEVPVNWYCTTNTYDGQGYIADCEMPGVMFHFQATPVGINCDPGMVLPVVTVMYEAQAAPVDHEGIRFQGTDIVVTGSVTTDDILNETGYDAGYRIVNEGTISAGASGRAVPNPVYLIGAIDGGAFDGAVTMAGGTIRGGTFNGRIESTSGTIRGGAFNGPIGGLDGKFLVRIDGGEFRGDIGDNEYDGYVFIEGGSFYCNIKGRNLTVGDAHGEPVFYNSDGRGGARKTVTLGTVGVIAAGTFYADVLNRNNITGGTFYGRVTNGGTQRNCNVLGGTFYGEFNNAVGGLVANPGEGSYGGARFPAASAVNNCGVLDGGDKVRYSGEAVITNEAGGTIRSGYYPCKVINYGTIAGGQFDGSVVNLGNICGGDYEGELYNEGGTVLHANLRGKLMSNTGVVKVEGLNVDPEGKVITVASGMEVSIAMILQQVNGDAAGYTIKNAGTISGGAGEVLPCDFSVESIGSIDGGTYTGAVYAGRIASGAFGGEVHAQSIAGGTFGGSVVADAIGDGTFQGSVNVSGNIRGGTFEAGSLVTAGTITGGTFQGQVTSRGRKAVGLISIYGGTFTGGVGTYAESDGAVIYGGTYNCDVGRRDASGYALIYRDATRSGAEPKFNGSFVGGRNVVIEWGEFSEQTEVQLYTVGVIAGGTFHGPVTCHNAITGGTFYGDVTMNAKPNGQIHGGTFYGHVHNKEGAYISEDGYKGGEPPKFLEGEVENEGVLDPGDGAEFGSGVTIVNRETGSIRSGVYNSPVANYGALAGGTYRAPVTTYRSIGSTPAAFQSAVMSVPTGELTIDEDASVSIEEIRGMEGYSASVRIINRGTITGGGTLPNTVTLIGNYDGGKVQGGVIEGGSFTGEIQSYYGMITCGTFSGDVVAVKGISAEARDLLKVETSEYTTLVITIAGGSFTGSVGQKGTGHVTVTGDPVFDGPVAARNLNIAGGSFNASVELSTVGTITGGTFRGPVTCNNAILGGAFYGDITIATAPNGQIFGGEFHGAVHNRDNAVIGRDGYEDGQSKYGPPRFIEGEIDNLSTMDPGAETVFAEGVTVVNQKAGNILSGVYRGPVRNYGVISNAVLYGDVENEGMIVNSIVLGKLSGNGEVTVEGMNREGNVITVEPGRRIPVDSIRSVIGDTGEGEVIVINNGTITAGTGDAALGCTVVGGTVEGGSFSGPVYAKVIAGGSFSGPVHDLDGDSVRAMPEDIRAAAEAAGMTAGAALLGGLSIQGGSFSGTVGGQGEAVFIHGGDFNGCTGVTADNLTVDKKNISFGEKCRVEFVKGDIAGGAFAGEVLNRNNVTGGTFTGKMINYGIIYGGSFSGGIENHGTIDGGATYTDYSEAWTFDRERNQWQHHGDPSEKRVTESDVTIDCKLTNCPEGVVIGSVNTGSGYELDDRGGKFETSALIGTSDGSSQVYSGERILCGAPVMRTLEAIDAAERLNSEWSYLDGREIDAAATISSDPVENAFLRTITWDVRSGELQLGMNWSEAEPPKAEYRSVRILPGTTVSGGVWNVPVINEGEITGGTFNGALSNKGSVSGAAINGAITAEAGTIENCTYGPSATVARVAEGASILVNITADGESRTAAYGANALGVLNGVKTRSGYDWYSIGGAEAAVKSADTIPLRGGNYALRKRPVPEILWPTASPIGVGELLSTSKLTSEDRNGTFRWEFPDQVFKTKGTSHASVVFVKNANNTYNYDGIETKRSIPVEIRENVITIAVNASYKYYSGDDPSWSAKVTGCKEADKGQLSYRFVRESGEDVGEYALTVEVDRTPANYTVNIIPSTFTIRPKQLSANLFSTAMGTVRCTGDVLRPVPVVKDVLTGATLAYGTDFTVEYDQEIVDAGHYAYTITGRGNYEGSFRRELSVAKGEAVVRTVNYTKVYGEPDPEFRASAVSGVGEGAKLTYEFYRTAGEGVGTYSIFVRQVSGGANFNVRLAESATLTILPKQLPNQVSIAAKPVYTGAAIEVKPVVRDGSATLTEGVDYALRCENNVNAGTATVVVTGMGNYTGAQRASFTIGRAAAEIHANDASKPLGAKDPALTATVTGALMGQKLNYTLTRAPGESVGDYAITVNPGSNPNYDVRAVPGTMRITPEPTSVEFSPAQLTVDAGASAKLTANLLPQGTASKLSYSVDNGAVASVGPDGLVKGLKAGVATVTVRTENGKTASCKVTVLPIPQELLTGIDMALTLTPADRSVRNYTFESSDTAVATVDNSGAVRALKDGTAEITAKSNGVALEKWKLRVAPKPSKVTLSAGKVSLGVGEPMQLSATVDTELPGELSWSTSNAKIATVDAGGQVVAKKTGSAKITVKTYNGVKAECTVSVSKAPTSIKLSASNVTLGCGDSLPISATLSKKSASAITYESTNEAVARVEGGRIVAGATTGTATITAKTFNNRSASCKVNVQPAPTSVSLGEALTIGKGQSLTLTPAMNNSACKATFTYASSDNGIASINGAGKLTGVKAGGTVTITATAHNGVRGSVQVTVKDAPSKVTLSAGSLSLGVGEQYPLIANLPEGSASPIRWSSSKSSVASVDANGLVTARKKGSAKITATTFNNRKVTCKVTVSKAPTSIRLSASSLTLGNGASARLGVTLSKKSASAITWTSSNESVATVVNGTVNVIRDSGTATITAQTCNGLRANCTVNAQPAPQSIAMAKEMKLGVKQSASLNTALSPAGSVGTLTYTSSNAKVATVNGSGVVTGKKAGTATITLTTHNNLTASCTVQVTNAPKKVYISAGKATVGAGQTYQLTASVTAGTVSPISWSSNKGSVATVDANGLVTAKGAGKAKITAKSYNGKKATCTITVTKAPTSVALNVAQLTLGLGDIRGLGVTLSKGSAGSITWSSNNDAVAAVANGKVTAKGKGTATITAATYNGLQATCEVTVVDAPSSVELGENQSVKKKKSLVLQPELPAGTAATLTYSTSNKKVATVDASGKVTGKKKGTATITVKTHNGKTDTCVITVK